MICDQCDKVLDLDTSFPPGAHLEGGPRVAHHKSYSALCQAARAHCEFCQLIVENTRGGSQEAPSPNLPDSKEQVFIQLFHDTIAVSIPQRITHSESGEDKPIGGDEFGEDNITLYISTEYSQFAHSMSHI